MAAGAVDRQLPVQRHWGAEMAAAPPEFEHAAVVADDGELLRFLDAVWTTGLAFVRGVPTNEDALRSLAERVGHVRETNFGRDFHVEAMVEPNNVAYTSVELRPHTDLPNRECPPGIQFLHCWVSDAPGGDSILVDGFWVADRIRDEDPEAFRLLCEVPIPYRFHDDSHDLRFAAPVISRRDDGTYREIRFHNALMDPLELPLGLIEPTYAALRRFDAVAAEQGGAADRPAAAGRCDGLPQPSHPPRAPGVRPGRWPPAPVRSLRRPRRVALDDARARPVPAR